jgi:hypothetical protein
MEVDGLKAIAEIQGQILALRLGASVLPDPKLQEMYLTIADLVEQFTREFDRTIE